MLLDDVAPATTGPGCSSAGAGTCTQARYHDEEAPDLDLDTTDNVIDELGLSEMDGAPAGMHLPSHVPATHRNVIILACVPFESNRQSGVARISGTMGIAILRTCV